MSERVLPPADALAGALVEGARVELDLTPKPGLVDRLDNGSHPDLSYQLMSRSIDLLPEYFRDLLEAATRGDRSLTACVAAGRRAEARMIAETGSNTHRGYIFLTGLVLLARAGGAETFPELRAAITKLAARILAPGTGDDPPPLPLRRGPSEALRDAAGTSAHTGERKSSPHTERLTHGETLRREFGLAGIHGEALAGLPSVFDGALPAIEAIARLAPAQSAWHYAMATLMTMVEDTTAVHRCGRAGLDRLREDGRRLRALIAAGGDYLPALRDMNDEYRAMRLTMGGVADCLALSIGLRLAA